MHALRNAFRVGGACSPPPPVAAPLVPRYALLPAATPRMRGLRPICTFPDSEVVVAVPPRFRSRSTRRVQDFWASTVSASLAFRGRTARTRGVAAGRSAQRGTSGAATGGGGRSAPDPDYVRLLLCGGGRRLPRPVDVLCVLGGGA